MWLHIDFTKAALKNTEPWAPHQSSESEGERERLSKAWIFKKSLQIIILTTLRCHPHPSTHTQLPKTGRYKLRLGLH